MAAYQKFNVFVENLAEKVHDLGADTLRVILSNTAPVATNTIKTNITEISAGNGYPGTNQATQVTSDRTPTATTYRLVVNDVVFTATGAVGPFQYVVLYNDTPTSPADPLIAFWDYGSSISLANTETFTVDFDATNGVLQIV